MANAELKVLISADGKQLASTMQKAERDLQSFNNETKKLPPSLARLDKSIAGTSRQLTAAGTAVKKSKFNFLEFGRVIQDLPFGFAGISNNLTQLIPGVGLAGIAFSALVSAITFSQIGLRGWGVSAESAGDKAKKAGADVETFAEEQKRLKAVFDDAAKSVIGQTTRIEDLGRALVDTTNKTAILTQATINQGLAQLLFTQKEGLVQKILSDALEKQLKTEKQLLSFKESEFKAAKKTGQLEPIRIASVQELNAVGIGLSKTEQQVFDLNKLARSLGISFEKFVDAPKENKAGNKFFDDLIRRAKALEAFINKTTVRFASFEVDPSETTAQTIAKAKEFINRALTDRTSFSLKPQILVENPVLVKSQAYFSSLQKESAKLLQDLQEEISKITKRNPILIQAIQVQAEQKSRGSEFLSALGLGGLDENAPKSLLTELQKEVINTANTVNSVLTPAFNSLFDAIKSGESPIKAFFQGLGNAVLQLIQKLVIAAVQALVIQAVLSAAGIGAPAGGIGAMVKSLLGFKAQGGPVFANKPYVVGEHGPELFMPGKNGQIIPNNQMNTGLAGIKAGMQTVNVVGQVSGRSLRLVNARQQGFEKRNV